METLIEYSMEGSTKHTYILHYKNNFNPPVKRDFVNACRENHNRKVTIRILNISQFFGCSAIGNYLSQDTFTDYVVLFQGSEGKLLFIFLSQNRRFTVKIILMINYTLMIN